MRRRFLGVLCAVGVFSGGAFLWNGSAGAVDAPVEGTPTVVATVVPEAPVPAPAAEPKIKTAEIPELLLFQEIPMVTSTGFFNVNKNLAPGSIYIITQSMLTDYPVRTLQNVWDAFIPGVAVGAEHVHLGPHFDVRGAQSPTTSTTLYMLNGNSFTDRLFTGYQWGQYSPLLGDIDRMEVILGPGSLTHGSGAMMGYVNQIQKNGKDNPGLLASAEYGNPNNLAKAEVNYGTIFSEDHDFYIYGGFVQAPGSRYKDDFGNWFDGSASRIEYSQVVDQKVGKISPSYRLSTNYRKGGFKFSGFIQDFSSSTDSPCTDDTAVGMRRDAVMLAAPEYTYSFDENNSIQIIPNFVVHDTVRNRFIAPANTSNNFDAASTPGSFEDAGAWTTMTRGKMVFRTTSLSEQKLAAGVDYSVSKFYLGNSLMDSSADVAYEGLAGDWTESSVFLEDVYAMTDAIQVSAGLRYDQVKYGTFSVSNLDFTPETQSSPSARIAAAYAINEAHSVKVSAQQGFAYATPGQLQWWGECDALSVNGGYGHIPVIKSAQQISYEANYHGEFNDLKLATDVNGYINKMSNWINWGDGATQLTDPNQIAYLRANSRLAGQHWMNMPDTTHVGGEIMLKYAPFTSTLLGVGYAYAQPYHSDLGKDIYGDYPTHQVKANLKLELIEKLTVTGNTIVENSAPLDFSVGAPGSFNQNTSFINPRLIVNLLLNYKIDESWSVSLTGMNVTENENMAMSMGKGYLNRNQRYLYLGAKFRM